MTHHPSSRASTCLVTVVLCTHQPRARHLAATLQGLRAQDLPLDQWELLVVDNACQPALVNQLDLSWHPQARLLVEAQPGLARARACAYRQKRGALVVHSDDDNVLAPDYLRTAWALSRQRPHLGTFGGQIIPEFDRPPRNDEERRFGGERLVLADVWSHELDDPQTMPFGAGMCLRAEVVDAYLAEVDRDPRRLLLGRTGQRFITGEDIDLNHVAVRTGYATGLFRSLRLIHLIPPERMTAEHFITYRAGNAYSMTLLWCLHTGRLPAGLKRSWPQRLRGWLRRWLRMNAFERRLEAALQQARRTARRDLRTWGWTT